MKAPKNIKIKLPEDIAKFREGMMTYDSVESRSAYLRLIKKKAEEYYKNNIDEYDWLEQDILKMIDKEINELKPDIEAERDVNKPLGWKYSEDVMELELDLYDTIEEQIEYLKNKLQEFDLDTINITTNEYDDIRNDFKIRIKNRQYLLAQNTNEKPLFSFDFQKIKKYANELQKDEGILYLKYVLKEFDREKRENFYLFMELNEIEYFNKNIVINEPEKVNEPPDAVLAGIGSKQKLAIENFERSIRNEIEFLQDKNSTTIEAEAAININEPKELEKMLVNYYDSGKECYLATWKDKFQILTFQKKMFEIYGKEVSGYIGHLYRYIAKRTNPIEFLGCDYENIRINYDGEKIKKEIIKIESYIDEITKLSYFTDEQNNSDNVPEDEIEKYEEWQCYYIDKIKNKELAEWINVLRQNRPGITDYKLGEFYAVEFKTVTDFALNEFKNYREKLISLQINNDGKTKIKRKRIKVSNEIIAEEVTKLWDDGIDEFEEIYKKLSENSLEMFGVQLTKDQIKGRYQRYSKEHKDFRREKY